MHFQGHEIISSQTQKSGRNLIATASTVLLALYYDVPLENLKILGVDIPASAVTGGTALLLVGLTANHLIHWMGDFLSMPSWNSGGRVNGEPTSDYGSPLVSKLDQALIPLKQIEDYAAKFGEEWLGKNGHEVEAKLADARLRLNEIRVSHARFASFAGFYTYGWYFALPVLSGLLAVGYLWQHSLQ